MCPSSHFPRPLFSQAEERLGQIRQGEPHRGGKGPDKKKRGRGFVLCPTRERDLLLFTKARKEPERGRLTRKRKVGRALLKEKEKDFAARKERLRLHGFEAPFSSLKEGKDLAD